MILRQHLNVTTLNPELGVGVPRVVPSNRPFCKGSQGMGVASSNRFDCVLLSIPYMFKPSC